MDKRILKLVNFTKEKFGLENYYLERHSFSRNVNIFNDTNYTLCMEWFPNHVTDPVDDDLNPEGAAVIEVDIHTKKFERVMFVKGKAYVKHGVRFANADTNEIVGWIEQETGLTYGKQFRLHKEEEGELYFKECIDGVAVSPSGFIDIKFDREGKLTLFSVSGHFPSAEMIKKETYTLSAESVEPLIQDQLKLVEMPSYKDEKIISVYAVEEIYIMNDGKSTIPYEFIVDVRSYLKINQTMYWDTPMEDIFVRKEISWTEDVSAEEAFLHEPSPALCSITNEEQEQCVTEVKTLLRQQYPDDTGKWMLKTLNRDKGYIHATLRANDQSNFVFQRKLKIMIDATSLQVVNYMDNESMLKIHEQFEALDKITITREEAYEKVKALFEIEPYYVYDFEQKQYILCGKIDCQYAVNAGTGEVISLSEL